MTSMTSYGYHSYKDRDRIQVLEKQVADLKLLTGQQSLTIGRLEEESSRKSDRISQLLGVESRPGRLTTTRQVSNQDQPEIQYILLRTEYFSQFLRDFEFWEITFIEIDHGTKPL